MAFSILHLSRLETATLTFILYVSKVSNLKPTYKLLLKDIYKHFPLFHKSNSIKDVDDTFFLTVKKLVSFFFLFFRKDRLVKQYLSKNLVLQTVNKLAIKKSSHFSNLDKLILRRNIDRAKVGAPNSLYIK